MGFLTEVVAWFSTHAVRLAVIGALSMALGVAVYVRGQESAAVKCASTNAEVVVKETASHGSIHEKVDKMSCADIDSALSKFLRSDN